MKKQDEHYEYAVLIEAAIGELFNEDSEFHIDLEDLEKEGNLTKFIHALANIVPVHLHNKLTGDNKDMLEFNHLANRLCFQFSNKTK